MSSSARIVIALAAMVGSAAGARLSNRSEAGEWVWTFVLAPENGTTRLISRNRISTKGAAAGQRLGMMVMEPGSLAMERKMLLGIRERAERTAAQQRS